jgi:hypothetical protein
MTSTTETLPAETGGTDITRFNALRHGVLSRYTVLPWESADEYRAVVEALVAEHGPQGPTEEHLVEEIAGILWRKRRLRLAEAAAHRRGLEGTLASYRETVKMALVHLDTNGQSERVVDAIRATVADTREDLTDMAADEALSCSRTARFQAKRRPTRPPWRHCARISKLSGQTRSPAIQTNLQKTKTQPPPMSRACAASSKARCCRGSRTGRRNWPTGR